MGFLSAPKFLSMPAVGLDISDDAVRFIELAPGKHSLEVARYATRNFPLGVVGEGHIKDKKKLADTIASLAYEFKLTYANVALPEEQAYLANMKIPRVAATEMRDAIEIRLEENVPIPGNQAVFDYVVVGDSSARKKEAIDVVVSVLPRAVVDEYLDMFKGTGITPKAFEFESQAMARSLVPVGDNGTFMIADVGKMITEIFVVASGVVQFSASLDIGGHYFTNAVMKKLGLTEEEAEKMKVEYGIIANEKNRALCDAMLPVINDLKLRLMQHYTYWQTHHSEKFGGNIERVYLSGGGANLRGLPEYLAMGLDVETRIANPWVNVSSFEVYVPPLLERESLGYSAAIGLALRDIITL
ncbi:MAG TPA: type IV pilus assembly protein PilM [Candidatus Paceibacterota bacterium]|nr:type IV pilus assembly protein PilM [Candidatus Paceibacterota bacterium]